MSDTTGDSKPWDLEQYRGVKDRPNYQADWDRERERELDDSHRTGRSRPIYAADGPSLFWLALWSSLLTVLTLGLYRFWMTTRLRRHYWQSIRVQGDPMEYTGTGLEKLLGFLMALIILAVYLVLVNLLLTFVNLSYFNGNPIALQISLLAAVPLFFFAEFRARRYIMARTRWRGIRFGMGDGAWGYTLKAILLWIVTLLSFGLLYPYKQFKLSKYITDRSWFGDLRFEQGGSWAGLFAYWVWIYIVVGLMAMALWGVFADQGNPMTAVIGSVIMLGGYFLLFVMLLRYQVLAFRYLWNNRTLGEAGFTCEISPAAVIKVYVFGSFGVMLFSVLVFAVMFALAMIAMLSVAGPESMADLDIEAMVRSGTQNWPALAMIAAAYLLTLVASFAFTQVFITQPILRRKAETMTINNVPALGLSKQRAHDHAAEAGGFADALGVDVGAGF